MEGYDVAQICKNGHVSNSSSTKLPQFNQKHCERCGAETIKNCLECDSPIRGYYWGGGGLSEYNAPNFCINCGKPYPWTKAKLQAAHELAQEIGGITDEDRIVLQNSIEELVKDSPSTPVAATRFKKIMTKAGKATAGMFREILVDVLSEATKKMLFP